MRKLKLLFAFTVCSILFTYSQTVYRVNPDATQTADGLTWESGYKTIVAAIVAAGDASPSVIEIWVKAGTYSEYFWMRNNVHIYGGFTGSEVSLNERDFKTNATTIKPSTPGQRIIYRHGANSVKNGVLDGFTLTGANMLQSVSNATAGGAAYLNNGNTLRNCILSGNSAPGNGGAVYMDNGSTLENCIITDNRAGNGGGGIAGGHDNTKPPITIINCKIINNTAEGASGGGGIFIRNSNVNIYNSLIANNTSQGGVSGLLNGSPTVGVSSNIINCTIVNNDSSVEHGSGVNLSTANLSGTNVINSIIYGNTSNSVSNNLEIDKLEHINISNTGVENIPDSITINENINLTTNQFVKPTSAAGYYPSGLPAYDWSLLETSHCINKGNNLAVFGIVDLGDNLRIQKEIVDLGAYESPYNSTSSVKKVNAKTIFYYDPTERTLYTTKSVTGVKLYNLQGALIYTNEFATNKISLKNINTGVYIINFYVDNQKFQQKILMK
jgi:predicted outer membrane repeat protein